MYPENLDALEGNTTTALTELYMLENNLSDDAKQVLTELGRRQALLTAKYIAAVREHVPDDKVDALLR